MFIVLLNIRKYKRQIQQLLNIQTQVVIFYRIGLKKGNNENNNGKTQSFLKSTNTNSPTSYSGGESKPPIVNSFMYIETSSNNHGNNVFVSFERTDIIQISNTTCYYNRFSVLTNDRIKSIGRVRTDLLLAHNTWSTSYFIAGNDRYSDTSTQWLKLGFNYTEEEYGIKLFYDEKDSAHGDLCFSKITIIHSII